MSEVWNFESTPTYSYVACGSLSPYSAVASRVELPRPCLTPLSAYALNYVHFRKAARTRRGPIGAAWGVGAKTQAGVAYNQQFVL